MDIRQATRQYETWLGNQIPLIRADLRLKHQRMRESPFCFLRATFYRWAQVWPEACPELAGAPAVLGVGDVHVENFGTWRDSEGRLVWGLNDLDEACRLPYANDLVRLAVSAQLAIREAHLSCDPEAACDALREGYETALVEGGRPFVLAEHHRWLRDLALNELRDPVRFWEKLDHWPTARAPMPAAVRSALKDALPDSARLRRILHRQAGLGSLGRRRFTALAGWEGGNVAREAKELVPSAWSWTRPSGNRAPILYEALLERAVRVPDPFLHLHGRWIVRRLAPDCSRIELAALPKRRGELRLLWAMGWETANAHLGSADARRRIQHDLARRPRKWLNRAATTMREATLADWRAWHS